MLEVHIFQQPIKLTWCQGRIIVVPLYSPTLPGAPDSKDQWLNLLEIPPLLLHLPHLAVHWQEVAEGWEISCLLLCWSSLSQFMHQIRPIFPPCKVSHWSQPCSTYIRLAGRDRIVNSPWPAGDASSIWSSLWHFSSTHNAPIPVPLKHALKYIGQIYTPV